MDFLIAAIITIVGISTPILLAGLGELVVEKSGVLNLGVEGMMLVGAIAGFAATVLTGNPWLGVIGAAIAGALAASLFGFFVLTLNSNQVATGLALTIFGTGLSSLIGLSFVGRIVPQFGSVFPPELARDPLLKVVFGYSPVVYFALIMVFAVGWFLKSTRAGLILRAVGENDLSAHSIGYSVIGVRYAAVAFGGAMAGIGGAYFSMVITPMWAERMTAGRGWIALALVVFAGWRAGRLLVGAIFFGVLMWMELNAKAGGLSFLSFAQYIPSQFWAAMPYLMTVVVLTLISMRDRVGLNAPACLGKPFLPAT
ncbi:ABC transporter permease [Devosia sp. Root413D1]|uniref:ABC transporter permease n=1 Tax=Devosia sp. Root413D1 TaxID=1736531 RepID=UPI0006F979F0|nr:ABC transporter permease [Devosia sp. Root413D1]KQW77443.1 ABC transporter permease [Devosia sp. Root413D1]